jgi:hypothetical protein
VAIESVITNETHAPKLIKIETGQAQLSD